MKSKKIKKLRNFVIVSAILSSTQIKAQLKVGFDARNLEAPKITLLDLKVDPSAVFGKGFTYPVVTQTQRELMKPNNGGKIPDGMTIYNSTVKAIQIYSADPAILNWISYSPLKSEILTIPESGLDKTVKDNITEYVLTNPRPLTTNGKVYIVYNHITLQKGVDFTIDELTKKISFLTLIPEEWKGFTQFEVEYNL